MIKRVILICGVSFLRVAVPNSYIRIRLSGFCKPTATSLPHAIPSECTTRDVIETLMIQVTTPTESVRVRHWVERVKGTDQLDIYTFTPSPSIEDGTQIVETWSSVLTAEPTLSRTNIASCHPQYSRCGCEILVLSYYIDNFEMSGPNQTPGFYFFFIYYYYYYFIEKKTSD